MIRMIAVAATILVLASAQGAAETERQLGPHQHGHGTLNLAVEGQTVQMELEVPGVDIVGFEHKAKTAEDRAKMEAAEKTLAQPLALFILPGEAGCKVTAAKVSIVGATEPDDDTHELDHHDHSEAHEADSTKPKSTEPTSAKPKSTKPTSTKPSIRSFTLNTRFHAPMWPRLQQSPFPILRCSPIRRSLP